MSQKPTVVKVLSRNNSGMGCHGHYDGIDDLSYDDE